MPRKKVEVVDETRNIALALKELCEELGEPVLPSIITHSIEEGYRCYERSFKESLL